MNSLEGTIAMHPLLPLLLALVLGSVVATSAQEPGALAAASPIAETGPEEIPAPLRPWESWVLRGISDREAPREWGDATKRMAVWPNLLTIDAISSGSIGGARFFLYVDVFAPSWVHLPGDTEIWPYEVQTNLKLIPVVERDHRPAVWLEPGYYDITGRFSWENIPNELSLPPNVGRVQLRLDAEDVPAPSWDPAGKLRFRQVAAQEAADSMNVKAHALLRDGIPLSLEMRIELAVSGTNREESLGTALPEGWQLASVESPIPVAVEASGEMKAQVRAGRWLLVLKAFQPRPVEKIGFAAGATPVASAVVLAFEPAPNFRQVEIMGLTPVDGSQTDAPSEWRNFSLFHWPLKSDFQLHERMRGAGETRAQPLEIDRSLWLDTDGKAYTFFDDITGQLEAPMRLEALAGWKVGSATLDGAPQLITQRDGVSGLELRDVPVILHATGRFAHTQRISATGWNFTASVRHVLLNLPPGYRLFAITGVDFSQGDWLTAWTLLDLFLVLLFTVAVHRLAGWRVAAVALVVLALTFHEPGAPRFAWFFLLVPLALVKFVKSSRWNHRFRHLLWVAAGFLAVYLVPFAAHQIQAALYPQLEHTSLNRYLFPQPPSMEAWQSEFYQAGSGSSAIPAYRDSMVAASTRAAPKAEKALMEAGESDKTRAPRDTKLWNDPAAAIQTGPGVPTWSWRNTSFGWDGPVQATQSARLILCPPWLTRCVELAQVIGAVLLFFLLLRRGRRKTTAPPKPPPLPATAATALLALALGGLIVTAPRAVAADFPPEALLSELREHLTDPGTAFPNAADLAAMDLKIAADEVTLTAIWHAADRCAVPVPVPVQAWHLTEATISTERKKSSAHLARHEGILWTLLPGAGIHTLVLQAKIDPSASWEWRFSPLKPRVLTVDAPAWEVNGLRADHRPGEQLLFSPLRRETDADVQYDRPETTPVLRVTREIELGLTWRVTTRVERLSKDGRTAIASIPLLPGEKVLSQTDQVKDGKIRVQLAPEARDMSWESELPLSESLHLVAREADSWTERWQIIAAPLWHLRFDGLVPLYISSELQWIPEWHPWPGETATVAISRPATSHGATTTVDGVEHHIHVGHRRQRSLLEVTVRSSLGGDFPIQLPANAEISSLSRDNHSLIVRKTGGTVTVPLQPGKQKISLEWERPTTGRFHNSADRITLPVPATNLTTTIVPGGDRWLLLPTGTALGPVFRIWQMLALVVALTFVLVRVPGNPLRWHQWLLLLVGLLQVPLLAAGIVALWLFALHWRGTAAFQSLTPRYYNLAQLSLIALTFVALLILVASVARGLLDAPDLRITGNRSSATELRWYADRSPAALPVPGYLSISIWWFRLLMLAWALWLASQLVNWLRTGWKNSAAHGHFRASKLMALRHDRSVQETTQKPAPPKP